MATPNKLAVLFLALSASSFGCVLVAGDDDDGSTGTDGGSANTSPTTTADTGADTAADTAAETAGDTAGTAGSTGGEPVICEAVDALAAECNPEAEGACAADFEENAGDAGCTSALEVFYSCMGGLTTCEEFNQTGCIEEAEAADAACTGAADDTGGSTGGSSGSTGADTDAGSSGTTGA